MHKKNITLEMNEKIEDEYYQLRIATSRNNIEIVQLLINYVNENNIIK